MDRFDTASLLLAATLLAASAWVSSGHSHDPKQDKAKQTASQVEDSAASAELASKGTLVGNLLEAGNLAAAEALARELAQKYPYSGSPHMLLGDLAMRKQDPIGAMHEYQQAVDFNPDYLDKKTPQFQGKKMKVAVAEALAEIEKKLKQNPGNDALKQEKKTAYYLYRKIAGSCG